MLKAILEDKNVKIPKIHDLEKLYGIILELGIRLKIDEDILAQINDVYIDARYPANAGLIPDGNPSLEKVQGFYELAKAVYEKTTSIIEKE